MRMRFQQRKYSTRNVKFRMHDYFPLYQLMKQFNRSYNIEIDFQSGFDDHCSGKIHDIYSSTLWSCLGNYTGLWILKKQDFVTVSWCHFQNHDKTMLIGYGKLHNDAGKYVTVHNNIFEIVRAFTFGKIWNCMFIK